MDSRSANTAINIPVFLILVILTALVVSLMITGSGLKSRVEALEKASTGAASAKLVRCPPELEGFPFSHSIVQSPARTGIDSAMLTCFYRKVPRAPST